MALAILVSKLVVKNHLVVIYYLRFNHFFKNFDSISGFDDLFDIVLDLLDFSRVSRLLSYLSGQHSVISRNSWKLTFDIGTKNIINFVSAK